jgi:hypothetical protein
VYPDVVVEMKKGVEKYLVGNKTTVRELIGKTHRFL